MPTNMLRGLPSVSELLESPPLAGLVNRISHNVVVSRVRTFLDDLRNEVQNTATEVILPSVAELAERIARRIAEDQIRPQPRPVINATGVLLGSELGPAPLADAAIEEMVAVARDYANVDFDLSTGQRGERVAVVEDLLRQATGAEAALVVNSQSSALWLTLAALAPGREAIVSRGELGEAAGGCRAVDLASAAGARLREVGSANVTRVADFDGAICDASAMLLVAQPSNYVITGAAERPPLAELVLVAHRHHLPLVHELGLGGLVDASQLGFAGEPAAIDSIKAGADLVIFGGDQLLGGPTCGVIIGRRDRIAALASHPLARMLEADKLTLAALAGTLRLQASPDVARREVPLLRLLSTAEANLKIRAERMAAQMGASPAIARAEAIAEVGNLTAAALPTQKLATWCVALEPASRGVEQLAAALRGGSPPVVGRVRPGQLLLDLRSVAPRHDVALVEAVSALAALG